MVTLAEYQASYEELEEENGEGEKELLMAKALEEVAEGPDEGEMLVIRRALSSFGFQNNLEQWENIFLARCAVSGKVCSLTINGGSSANVASKSMVEKLSLVVSPRPSPYTIQWLNKGKGLQISSRCFLTLPIRRSCKARFGVIL